MNASSTDRWFSGSIDSVRLPKRYGSTLAWKFNSLSSSDGPRLPGIRASSPSGKPITRYVSGFWLNALALPCRMTPMAGLKELADADGLAPTGGGVTGPTDQGSCGGVLIVKAGGGAGVDGGEAASEIAIFAEGGGGTVAATGLGACGGGAARASGGAALFSSSPGRGF